MLVLAAGCLDSDSRPYDDFLSDLSELSDAGPDADSGATDAGTDGEDDAGTDAGQPVCSDDPAGDAIAVTFRNRAGTAGDLYFVDSACNEQNLVLIPNGQDHVENTFVGHAFRLRAIVGLDLLGEVKIAADQTVVTFQ